MFHAITRIGVACALTLGVVATANAQSAQANADAQQKKEKRRPADLSQSDQPTASASVVPADRAVDAVPVEFIGNALVAHLDESFMEAVTMTRQDDGTLRVDHILGSREAAAFVEQQHVAGAHVLPARILPTAYPIYEVK
jgi:hypothetical protein